MFDQAATPSNLQPGTMANTANGTSGEFGTTNPSTATTPQPAVTPIQYPGSFLNNQGLGNAIGSSIAKSAGSGGGGGLPIGSILGGIGSLFSAIFAQGGLVGDGANGFAQGGSVDDDGPASTKSAMINAIKIGREQNPYTGITHGAGETKNNTLDLRDELKQKGLNGFAQGGSVNKDPKHAADMTIGYLVGAHHQQNYGGTPDTLQKAAQEIKQMLMDKMSGGQQSQGFASGGSASNTDNPDASNQQLVMQAIAQALGTSPDQTQSSSNDRIQAQQPNPNPNEAVTQPPTQTPQIPSQSTQSPTDQQNQSDQLMANSPALQNMAAQQQGFAPGGYMQKLAVGGPPIEQGAPMQAPPGDQQQGNPPLQLGQTFQGDGSVKGPGGPTDDAIPAKLSNGEFVFSQPAVQFFGVDKLTKMNEQGKQGFMQAINQVQQNQQQPPGGQPPMGPPQGQPAPQSMMPPQGASQQPPMMQSKGGITMKQNNGFMGM